MGNLSISRPIDSLLTKIYILVYTNGKKGGVYYDDCKGI